MDSDVNLDSAPFQSVKYSSASPDLGEYFTAHFPNDDPALDATDSSVVDDLRRQLKVNRQSDLYILSLHTVTFIQHICTFGMTY